jgi:hypothetical protein
VAATRGEGDDGDGGADAKPKKKRSTFFYVRLSILLTILAIVIMYAGADVWRRRARLTWDHTLHVAVVIVYAEPVDPTLVDALRAGLPDLESQLARELTRYKPGAPAPFAFRFFGPVKGAPPPPRLQGDGISDLVEHSFVVKRWVRGVDDALHDDLGFYDSRIYVFVRPAATTGVQWLEGESEDGGRIGVVSTELDPIGAPFSLFAVAHELLHTLGASDKYDEQGRAVFPGGYVDPEHRYPQAFAELMARGRPIAEGIEVPVDAISEIAIGAETAREIRWLGP